MHPDKDARFGRLLFYLKVGQFRIASQGRDAGTRGRGDAERRIFMHGGEKNFFIGTASEPPASCLLSPASEPPASCLLPPASCLRASCLLPPVSCLRASCLLPQSLLPPASCLLP
ncbi:MAG: hypothetical protein F6K41_19300 [Symploca sp. SIO3E6]|nr:hypothetical protein [Caldora sp. SIO3E6]